MEKFEKIMISEENIANIFPLSPYQEMLYEQASSGALRSHEQVILEVRGKMNSVKIISTFEQLVLRHEALRTVMYRSRENLLMQLVLKKVPLNISFNNITESANACEQLKQMIVAAGLEPFQLAEDSMLRLSIAKCADNVYQFIWTYHPIVLDSKSIALLIQEFFSSYNNDCTLPGQPENVFESFVSRLNKEQAAARGDAIHNFHDIQRFGRLPYHRGKKSESQPCVLEHCLEKTIVDGLSSVAITAGTTLEGMLTFAWGLTLSKYVDRNDVLIEKIDATDHASIENGAIGCFVNHSLVNVAYREGKTVESLQAFATYFSQPQSHLACDFRKAQTSSYSKLPRYAFGIDHFPFTSNRETFNQYANPEEGLFYSIMETRSAFSDYYEFRNTIVTGEDVRVRFQFNGNTYESRFIKTVLDYFINVLSKLSRSANESILKVLRFPSQQQRHLISNTAEQLRPHPDNIISLFERRVIKSPLKVAVQIAGVDYTYKEINQQANRLANYLIEECHIRENEIVGLVTRKTINYFIGMIGILKARAAFLPITAETAGARINFMLSDASARICLTDSDLLFNFENYEGQLFAIDLQLPSLENSDRDPSSKISSYDLAYVMYTAGSSGNPKGVMIEHRSLVNLCLWHATEFDVSETSKATLYSEIGFDASVWECWPYLIQGACIYVVPENVRLDIGGLEQFFNQHDITHSFLPTHICEQLPEETTLSTAMVLLTSGDRLRKVRNPHLNVFNNYGSTESAVVATSLPLKNCFNDAIIPIGRSILRTEVMVLDEDYNIQPIGVAGEIYIAGAGLARGYLNQPELTESLFVENPFGKGDTKMYRTGDIGKRMADGNVEFIGKRDAQVKIRGRRIETAEIENILLGVEDIRQAVIKVNGDYEEGKQIVAYYVSAKKFEERFLKDFLLQFLPAYMVPDHFMKLDSFPLTVNGKIDYKVLPQPELKKSGNEYLAPKTAIQKKLAGIFEEILGIENVGIDQNFFKRGGHSLKAIQLLTRIDHEFNVVIRLTDIFKTPTIGELSILLEKESNLNVAESLVADSQEHYYPVSHAQKRLWLLDQVSENESSYNIVNVYEVSGALDPKNAERSFRDLIARHEALRTTFLAVDGEPRQLIHSADSIDFKLIHVPNKRDQSIRQQITSLVNQEKRYRFDLNEGPLMRVLILQQQADRHFLVLNMHHIVTDGWSMEVLARDFISFYSNGSLQAGKELPALKIQYKDFAVAQQSRIRRGDFERHRQYWNGVFGTEPKPLRLPVDYDRPGMKRSEGMNIVFNVGKGVSEKLLRWTEENNATLFMGLMSVIKILLYKYTRQTDIVVGTPVAARQELALENQVGIYLNMLALRSQLKVEESVTAFLKAEQAKILNAFEHQEYPFDMVTEGLSGERDYSRSPLFDVGFTWQNTQGVVSGKSFEQWSGLSVRPYEMEVTQVKTDLWFMGWMENNEIVFSLSYDISLYQSSTIRKLIEDMKMLLAGIARDPSTSIENIISYKETNSKNDMNEKDAKKSLNLDKFLKIQAKPKAALELDVEEDFITTPTGSVLMIRPRNQGLILRDWMSRNSSLVKTKLHQHGAVIFRGFNLASADSFRDVNSALSPNSINYINRSSPRSEIGKKLYTSTDHPSDQVIRMHNELSYSAQWPMQILFFCLQPSVTGGETPIADSRKILQLLSHATKRKFREKGIQYVRNMVDGIGLSWREVYQTSEKSEVEKYCLANGIDYRWISDSHLRVSWRRPAIHTHPVTLDEVWFNHGYFYSPYNLEEEFYDVLTNEGDLPFCSYFGDGTPIAREIVEEISAGYEKSKIIFPWEKGDLLVLDNMLMAHGRNSYAGERKILVAMNELHNAVE